MKTFKIQLAEDKFTVQPLSDGFYRIHQNEQPVAHIYPEITAAGVYWNGFGQINPLLAEKIVKEIYAWEI